MPPRVASLLCFCFVAWLFQQDKKYKGPVSPALWLPLTWMFIVASRPLTTWFGFSAGDDPLEGSPLDRMFYLVLIAMCVAVLMQRNLNWNLFAANNRWLIWFFAYLGLSCAWSDYPFVAFKRWIKDVGNILMVLIILTDKNPLQAVKTVLARACFLLIPFSVILVKYYPDSGRYYDRWNGRAFYCGVTTDKNMLGMTLFACGLALVLLLVDTKMKMKKDRRLRFQFFIFLFLGALLVWLLNLADSSTAIACTILGAVSFWAMQYPAVQKRINQVGTWTVTAVLLLLTLHVTVNIVETIVTLLGRDMTFTGRTFIWERVLAESEDINPLLGAGFYSFWLGERVDRISEGYYGGEINEAHNAFLETYVNSGWIGVFLVVGLLLSAGGRVKRQAAAGDPFSCFRLTALLVAFPYSMTEAIFNRLSLIWFVLLLVLTEYQVPLKKARPIGAEKKPDEGQGTAEAFAEPRPAT
jgi:exopolysaccharide production protein ExoQ